MPRPERKERLKAALRAGSLTDDEALVASYAWDVFWARENQLAPSVAQNGVDDWRVWLLLAGRGFGKTRTGCEWARAMAEAGQGPGAIVGRTAADVRDVLIEGPAGIMAISPPWFRPVYNPSKRRLTWPNGVYALTFSAEEPDQLRGPQHAWALADEFAAWQYLADAWSNLQMGLRLGRHPQLAVMTTPRPLPLIRQLVADKRNAVTRGATKDNRDNLAASAIEDLERRYAGTRLGRQELEGEILDDVPGALWTRDMIEQTRPTPGIRPPPLEAFERIVVGVDPSGSDGERGDFIGIVAAGRLNPQAAREWGKEFVVLADMTCQERPEQWARLVIDAYDTARADKIIAEGNYGGDMVRALIQAVRPNAPVDLVHASRGKHVRAEPVSALYEQKKVMHAEAFTMLEDELCMFTPTGYKGEDSPNRADAAVWALTALAFNAPAEPFILV